MVALILLCSSRPGLAIQVEERLRPENWHAPTSVDGSAAQDAPTGPGSRTTIAGSFIQINRRFPSILQVLTIIVRDAGTFGIGRLSLLLALGRGGAAAD